MTLVHDESSQIEQQDPQALFVEARQSRRRLRLVRATIALAIAAAATIKTRGDAQMTHERLSRTARNRRVIGFSVALFCVGGIAAGVALTGGPGASTTQPSSRSLITRQQAIAIVEKDARVVLGTAPPSCHCAKPYHQLQGITRIAAKLMTFGQLVDGASPNVILGPGAGVSLTARVWVVAVSATVHPGLGLSVQKPDTWAVIPIDQQTGTGHAFMAGRDGNWPPYFYALPDLSHAS